MFSLRLPVLSDGAPVGKLYLSMNSHATEDAIFRSLLFLSLRKILDENLFDSSYGPSWREDTQIRADPQPAQRAKKIFFLVEILV
jgi:hypothetical protein